MTATWHEMTCMELDVGRTFYVYIEFEPFICTLEVLNECLKDIQNAFPGENVWCHEGENSSQGCENYGFLSGPDNADGNTTGFTALPAGYRSMVVYESYPWVSRAIRDLAYFWTSTEYSEDTTEAYSQTLKFDGISVNNGDNFTSFPDVHDSKGYGFSIRCIAD